MEPTKQGGDGPSDLNASNDPAQRRGGSSSRQPPPSFLVEQAMPLPPLNRPQLLHHQQQPYPPPSVPNFNELSYFAFPGFFPRASLQSHAFVNPDPQFAYQLAPSFHQSTPSSSANGHHPGAAAYFSLWGSNPYASLAPYASHGASMASFSANVPQPGAASAFSMGGPNAFAGLNAPPTHLTESQRLENFVQAIGDLPPEDFLARLLNAEPLPDLVISRRVSGRVASLLDLGAKGLRVWVIQAVSRDVHKVMGFRPAVFLALLRAVEAVGGEQELRIIVEAATSRRGLSLMSAGRDIVAGANALSEFFRVVRPYDRLFHTLFGCFVDGWIMEQSNGPELLQYLFTNLKLEYVYWSIFVNRVALPRFTDMVKSKSGTRCMLLCLQKAMSDAKCTEFLALEEAILSYTVVMAKNPYGNIFLQDILKGGYDILENPIRGRVEQDLQELLTHSLGSNLVEACYVPHPEAPELLLVQRGLDAFLALNDTQLAALGSDCFASCVLCKLLGIGRDIEPVSVWARSPKLARRISKSLEAADQGNPVVQKVMEVLQKVLSRQQQPQ